MGRDTPPKPVRKFRRAAKRASRDTLRDILLAAAGALVIAFVVYLAVAKGGRRTGTGPGETDPARLGDSVPKATIFYSCDLQGRLAPYTCEEGSLGGVARMATVLNSWAKEHPNPVIVDVGNSAIVGHEAADSINAFTFTALDKLGYDVVNCGDNEAALSLDELRSLSKGRKFKLISANLVRADTRAPIFPTHHVARRRGVQIAFIGLLREDILPKHPGKGVRLLNPAAALRSVINTVKDAADVIVVLAFLPPEEIFELARKHPEVQLFLGGLTPVSSAPYEIAGPRAGPTSIVSYLGDQGCTLARLEGAFPKGQLPVVAGHVAILDKDVQPDPAFSGLLGEFRAALSGKPLPGASQDPRMPCTSGHVGSDVCKLCHLDEFYRWQGTPHAGAYVALLEKGRQKDPACLACHTVGYGMPGGFVPDKPPEAPPKAEGKEAADQKGLPSRYSLQGVGCECCHGGSRHHLGLALRDRVATAKTPLLRPAPSRGNCTRCHVPSRPCRDPGTADTYDHNEYMGRIKHWKK